MDNTQYTTPVMPAKKKKWLKRVLILAVVAAFLAAVLAIFLMGGKQTLTGNYIPAVAETRDLTVTVTGPGTIKPNDTFRATTLVKGEILDAPFEEGDSVSEDDLLFQIDANDVENNISRAQLGVEQAELAYQQLLRNQKDTRLEANADGIVQSLPFDPGDNIPAGSVVAVILDNQTMKLTVPFHDSDTSSIFPGQTVTVAVDGTAELLTGTVDEISAVTSVGMGGTLVRPVTIKVPNPGTLDVTNTGTASIGDISCASSGSFEYAAHKQVLAKTSGELETLYVKEGDRVTDGQVLGEFDGDLISDQIENARLSLESARLSLQSAQDALDNYRITSPINGTVIEKNYKAGDNVDPSTAAATGAAAYMAVIYDMSRLTFDIHVAELDVGKLQVGQPVTFTADALEDQTFHGSLEKININGVTVNGNTTYPVTVAVEGDGEELAKSGLYPGMNVSANVIVEEAGQVLTVPVDAVTRGNVVLVAQPGALNAAGQLTDPSKLTERQVTLGRNDSEYIEVLSGLEEGETVFIQNSSSSGLMAMMGMMGG